MRDFKEDIYEQIIDLIITELLYRVESNIEWIRDSISIVWDVSSEQSAAVNGINRSTICAISIDLVKGGTNFSGGRSIPP